MTDTGVNSSLLSERELLDWTGYERMKTVTHRIREHLLWGVFTGYVGDKAETLESLRASEWCPEFERHMRAGLLMGRFRYGRMDRKTNTGYARIESAIRRLALYRETGNLECLRDVANLMMLEYRHGEHPLKHFRAIDDGEHVEKQ